MNNKYTTTTHSVTLASEKPQHLARKLSAAGRPKPNTRVKSTEKPTRSATLTYGNGAILRRFTDDKTREGWAFFFY